MIRLRILGSVLVFLLFITSVAADDLSSAEYASKFKLLANTDQCGDGATCHAWIEFNNPHNSSYTLSDFVADSVYIANDQNAPFKINAETFRITETALENGTKLSNQTSSDMIVYPGRNLIHIWSDNVIETVDWDVRFTVKSGNKQYAWSARNDNGWAVWNVIRYDNGTYASTWNGDFEYYADIRIENNQSAKSNHVVRIALDLNQSRTNGTDLLFEVRNSTSTIVNHYRDPNWNATTASGDVWVRVPYLPAGNTTIRVYFNSTNGTPGTETGHLTFDIFDDFSGATLNTSKWTAYGSGNTASQSSGILTITQSGACSTGNIDGGCGMYSTRTLGPNHTLHFVGKWSTTTGYPYASVYFRTDQDNYGGMNPIHYNSPIFGYHFSEKAGVSSGVVNMGTSNTDMINYRRWSVTWYSDRFEYTHNNSHSFNYTNTAYIPTSSNANLHLQTTTGGVSSYFDYLFVVPDQRNITAIVGPENEVRVTEDEGRNAIISGIATSEIASSYTVYYDRQVYIRIANGSQYKGTFDVFVAAGDKRWAFNYDENTTTGFPDFVNITPVFWVWQAANMSAANITSNVNSLIDSTN